MRQSPARILFTENGQPVPGLPVRPDDDAAETKTDDDGQVEVALEEGRQVIQVLRDGEWTAQVVEVTREASLIIVDLNKPNGRELGKQPKPETSFLDIGKLNLGDRYVYDEVLGRGGMSVVLKARDRLLNRNVAIKLLSQELAETPEAQNIFLTEARSLATLSHPNLVAVHDICKVDDQVFIVIEYVEGESLEALITAVKGFNETVALQTIIQLARVVAYLHDHGLVHRDLKPANAMIRNDGTLKLIDFGLARHFDDLDIRGTRVRGTPAYMSPEQIQGDKLTAASDVYQLGVCLFEVLTGRLPFQTGDVGYSHVHDEPPRVEELNPDVSELLSALVASCLAKSPGDRPGDGQELLRELQAIYQATGASGGNLLDQLRREIGEAGGVERVGYSTSEVHMMEDAGKHLRTSDFAAKAISEMLSDPDTRSQVIINQGSSKWLPIIAGVGIGAAVTSTALLFLVLQGGPQAFVAPPEPAQPAVNAPARSPVYVPPSTPPSAESIANTTADIRPVVDERGRRTADRVISVARDVSRRPTDTADEAVKAADDGAQANQRNGIEVAEATVPATPTGQQQPPPDQRRAASASADDDEPTNGETEPPTEAPDEAETSTTERESAFIRGTRRPSGFIR